MRYVLDWNFAPSASMHYVLDWNFVLVLLRCGYIHVGKSCQAHIISIPSSDLADENLHVLGSLSLSMLAKHLLFEFQLCHICFLYMYCILYCIY